MYINRICQLIEKANLFSSSYNANREIKCIADLLHRIGPSYQDAKREYINYYNKKTDKTYTMHHFYKSWLSPKLRLKSKVKKIAASLIGGDNIYKLRTLIPFLNE